MCMQETLLPGHPEITGKHEALLVSLRELCCISPEPVSKYEYTWRLGLADVAVGGLLVLCAWPALPILFMGANTYSLVHTPSNSRMHSHTLTNTLTRRETEPIHICSGTVGVFLIVFKHDK